MQQPRGQEPSLFIKCSSACGGALLTSLLMTPFDVVKTRLQAQAPSSVICAGTTAAECPRCSHYIKFNGLMEFAVEKASDPFFSKRQNPTAFGSAASATPGNILCKEIPFYSGTSDAFVQIARQEGYRGLYRGLSATLVLSIPSTVIYYVTYDELKAKVASPWGLSSNISALLCGMTARVIASCTIAPMELVRTRMQAKRNASIISEMRKSIREGGYTNMWRGLLPTLWRDVPFSGIYWLCFENVKRSLIKFQNLRDERVLGPIRCQQREGWDSKANSLGESAIYSLAIPFASGAISGMVAAIATHPFDVMKTRQQVALYQGINAPRLGLLATARQVLKDSGMKGFYTGLPPRLAKIMPACAIMISSYEFGKRFWVRELSSNNSNL